MTKKVSFKIIWSEYSLQSMHLSQALFSSEARDKILSFSVENHPFGTDFPNVRAPLLLFDLEGIIHKASLPLILLGEVIDLKGRKHKATIEYDTCTLKGQGEVEIEEEETAPAEKVAAPEKTEEINVGGEVSYRKRSH